jgi:hypothetical protein
MTDVQSIEKAVARLAPDELAEFRRWFAEFDAAAWDAQIESDAVSGRLDRLADEALADYRSGKAREI